MDRLTNQSVVFERAKFARDFVFNVLEGAIVLAVLQYVFQKFGSLSAGALFVVGSFFLCFYMISAAQLGLLRLLRIDNELTPESKSRRVLFGAAVVLLFFGMQYILDGIVAVVIQGR